MLELFLKSLPAFGKGILITLEITIFALIFATVIGLVVGLINIGKNKILKAIAKNIYRFSKRDSSNCTGVLFVFRNDWGIEISN